MIIARVGRGICAGNASWGAQAGEDASSDDVMATDGANSWKPERGLCGWRHLVGLRAVLLSFAGEKHLSV